MLSGLSGAVGRIKDGWGKRREGRNGGCHAGLLRGWAPLSQALPGSWSCLLAKVASMLRRSKDDPCGSDLHIAHGTGGWVQSEGTKMRHVHAMRLPGPYHLSFFQAAQSGGGAMRR